jgi:hypothetical protein
MKFKHLNGIPRIIEDEDAGDRNTDSLEVRDSKGYLVYVHSDGECENENTITQNEIDLCDE